MESSRVPKTLGFSDVVLASCHLWALWSQHHFANLHLQASTESSSGEGYDRMAVKYKWQHPEVLPMGVKERGESSPVPVYQIFVLKITSLFISKTNDLRQL